MRISALIIFLFLSHQCLAQSQITLRFYHGQEPVPYVSILDESLKLYRSSDTLGKCMLPADSYSFKISHVSYEDVELVIAKPEHDTIINVQLRAKHSSLESVRVVAGRKPGKRKMLSFGNYYKKSASRFSFPLNQRIAMILKPDLAGQPRYLNSIKFRLRKPEGLKDKHDNMEVRLYSMEGGNVSEAPVNTIPLYLEISKLGKSNEVKVKERIRIPAEGLLVSFEFPAVAGIEEDVTLNFVCDIYYDDSNLFISRLDAPEWNKENFWAHRLNSRSPMTGKYMQLNIGITYY